MVVACGVVTPLTLRRAAAVLDQVLPVAPPGPPGLRERLADAGRDLALGLVETGSLELLELQRWIGTAVRQPQVRPRVIAVIAGKGGVGATTTALAIATTLAALRDDGTALVGVHPGSSAQGNRLPFVSAAARTANDALDIVDSSTQRHTFTVLDVGNDASVAAQAVLPGADQVVVVTGVGPDAIEHARLALRRTSSRDGALVVAVRTRRDHGARAVRPLAAELGLAPDRVVPVAYDAGLARAGWESPAVARRATRATYLTVTALVALGDLLDANPQPSR